jgi:copper chaperone CopZ
MKTTAIVQGTHCPSCVALIKDICSDFSAITSCALDYTTGRMELEHTEDLSLDSLKKEIETIGKYTVLFD